jgi:disulfide bond formation protein DsbB
MASDIADIKREILYMLDKLTCLSRSSWYWLGLIATGLAMEGIALYFQYGLNYGPCVLCIHIRIWVLALILMSTLGLLLRHSPLFTKFTHISTFIIGIGFTERSWQTLAVERGWIIDSCSMDSGLPDWFALDKWIPQIFEPWEPCGYTPELLFGITMAETLMLFSIVLLGISLLFSFLQFRSK